MKRDYIRCGVTSPIPTLASDTLEGWEDSAKKICTVGFDGVHFEGRYLNEKKRGAHAPHLLSLPSADEIQKIISWVNIPIHITLAPELLGGDEAILRAVSLGATIGIGHTNATASEARRALTLGAYDIEYLEKALCRPEFKSIVRACALVKRKASLDKPFFFVVGQHNKIIFFKLIIESVHSKGKLLDPYAKMLVDTVTVIYAAMYLVRSSYDYISSVYRIQCVLNKKRNVTAEVYIQLVKIVYMLSVTVDIVYSCKAVVVAYFGENIVHLTTLSDSYIGNTATADY
jgi:hypothetical protein